MIKTDVLIAGYGPTGATLAAFLGLYGVRAIAIDKEREVYRQPRAAHFDHEIMRVWQRLGIAEQVTPHTRLIESYEFRSGGDEILMRFRLAGLPTPSGWAPSYMFHQPAIEAALRERVAKFSNIDVRLGTSIVAIEQNDASGVVARIADGDGKETRVQARFLVGADGGGSPVRRMIDGELFDYGFDEPWLVIDTVVKDEDGLPPFALQLCDPKRPITVMPMSPLRRRWEFMLLPGETPERVLDDGFIQSMLAPWVRTGQAEVVRKAVYRFHGLVATNWRRGRVLLAGDAAHQMPPFAGQGMCSGLRDAANLAWKLAFVLRGEAGVGSSRLAQEFGRARGALVVVKALEDEAGRSRASSNTWLRAARRPHRLPRPPRLRCRPRPPPRHSLPPRRGPLPSRPPAAGSPRSPRLPCSWPRWRTPQACGSA